MSGFDSKVSVKIGPNTKFILSTSGRLSSIERYRKLLQDILKIDIAYIPINSGSLDNGKIDPQRFVAALKGMPCIGGAISRDIKHSVIPFLDELDDIAHAIQSVNTVIVLPNGKLRGYNTDAIGFRKAIVEGTEKAQEEVKSVVCYGYGGVASVVTTILKKLGFEVFLAGRNLQKAARRAKELDVELWSTDVSIDLFVNATPASESPLSEAPFFLDALRGCRMAFDHEMPGRFLAEYCQENGVVHLRGTDMYYPQMYSQWSLFLNDLVPAEDIPGLIAQAEG